MKPVLIIGGILAASTLAGGCTQTKVQSESALPNDSNSLQGRGGAGSTPDTQGGRTTTGRADKQGAGIRWAKSMDAALQEAKRTRKPIMVDFYADWCGPCKMLDEYVYTDASVIEQTKKWVSVKVDVDKDQETAAKYGVTTLPTIGFLKPDGTVIAGFTSVPSVSNLLEVMNSSAAKVRDE